MPPQTQPAKGRKKKDWHVKIAANRGEKWRKNLAIGKRESQLNPSVIKIVRLRHGIDQVSVAEKLDVSPATFGAIERGKQKVKLDKARLISKLLKTPIEKLFKPAASLNTKRKKFVAILQRQAVET